MVFNTSQLSRVNTALNRALDTLLEHCLFNGISGNEGNQLLRTMGVDIDVQEIGDRESFNPEDNQLETIYEPEQNFCSLLVGDGLEAFDKLLSNGSD